MVTVTYPPPATAPIRPVIKKLNAGSFLYRLFMPGAHKATVQTFRHYGPLHRFDHQRGKNGAITYYRPPENTRAVLPAEDSERGIYYASPDFLCCLAEVFGDSRLIQGGTWRVGRVRLMRDLSLLDLSASSALRAGTNAAIAKHPNRILTQAWSRYFYDMTEIYGAVDGLYYLSAYADLRTVAIYERAKSSFKVAWEKPLTDRTFRSILDICADKVGFTLEQDLLAD